MKSLAETIDSMIGHRLKRHTWIGIVVSVSGNLVYVIRPEADVQDPEPYPSAHGVAAGLSAGDQVSLMEHAGRPVVQFKIVS